MLLVRMKVHTYKAEQLKPAAPKKSKHHRQLLPPHYSPAQDSRNAASGQPWNPFLSPTCFVVPQERTTPRRSGHLLHLCNRICARPNTTFLVRRFEPPGLPAC